MTVSRRVALGLGLAAVGAVIEGCSRAGRTTTRGLASPDGSDSASRTPSVSTQIKTTQQAKQPAPPTSSVKSLAPAVEIARGAGTRPQVALTFHGAGDPGIARELLAIFAAHTVRVTVLAVGTWLESNRRLAPEIVAAGHELGNHTYSHLDIDNLDRGAAQTEIARCRDLLVSLVGSGGSHFRPSQTQHATALVRALAAQNGYPVCLSYDIDSLDYTDPGPPAIRANVARARAGSVVSLHFGHPGTVTAMPGILDDLAARRLQAVTATELLRA